VQLRHRRLCVGLRVRCRPLRTEVHASAREAFLLILVCLLYGGLHHWPRSWVTCVGRGVEGGKALLRLLMHLLFYPKKCLGIDDSIPFLFLVITSVTHVITPVFLHPSILFVHIT